MAMCGAARGQIATVPTMAPTDLAAALNPTGLTITSVVITNGVAGQFGTYAHFTMPPVTIRDGVVMSSGSVASIGPLAEVLVPGYDPASPPEVVSNQMQMDADGSTAEFNAYGSISGKIENFQGSFDVAAMEVHFTLASASQVKFDFIFGSVEFPFYTSSFTDAFLVFLDGFAEADQVAFDLNNNPVQVGASFAGRTTTADVNTAFAAPHGLIDHLTTTTRMLGAGPHAITFEVGDVNDHILDSAVFITNLRTGSGSTGTVPSEDCRADFDENGTLAVADIFAFSNAWFEGERDADFNGSHALEVADIFAFLNAWFAGCVDE
jgi:hypothetical protein